MLRGRSILITVTVILSSLAFALPASAVALDEKLSALSNFTQTSASSQNLWLAARSNQPAWAAYTFDWSTDYCTDSPDNPLGFDFKLSCARHDFGYRNYKAVGLFTDNKDRVDSAFYADLKRKCATYASYLHAACNSVAWIYYEAVRELGFVAITAADLQKAAELLPATERAQRLAS